MDEDLFTYEAEIPRLASIPCDLKEEDDLDDGDLYIYKLRVDGKVKEEVVYKWLVRSYKEQFDEYMEIKKRRVTHRIDADMEYDPSNVEFAEWLASKFYNHKTMDRYTKNALWIYWTRGDDEVELTNEEFSVPADENLMFKDEVAEILRIETNIFGFETPMCKASMNSIIFSKSIQIWKDDGYCNGGNLPGTFKIGNKLRYQDLEWYDALEDGKLKDEALKNKTIMEGSIDEDDESCDADWNS
nr:C2 calcium/lipid-binding domain, CaLB [Tanacetum cinerariifolium]